MVTRLALAGLVVAGATHPVHTSLTEVSYSGGAIRVSVRVFADDFRAALRGEVADSSAAAYLRQALVLSDRGGTPLRLEWCGMHRIDDLLWLYLRARAPSGSRGLSIRNTVQWELFEDQLNIVRANLGSRRVTLVFARGDGPQSLP